jgi:hypothetical protein
LRWPGPLRWASAIFGFLVVASIIKANNQAAHQFQQLRDISLRDSGGRNLNEHAALLDWIADGAMDAARAGFGPVWTWLVPPSFGFVLLVPVALAFVLVRHLRQQAARADFAPHAGTGTKHLDYLVETASQVQFEKVPRALLNNPYSSAFTGLSLQERVAIAVEASVRAGRRAGAIVLRLEVDVSAPPGSRIMDTVQSALQSSVRQSDYVGIINGNHIVIFISLLNTKNDLLNIANRLHAVAATAVRAAGCPAQALSKPGAAIYPLDGYDADDLVESASRRAHPWMEVRTNPQTLERTAAALPARGWPISTVPASSIPLVDR